MYLDKAEILKKKQINVIGKISLEKRRKERRKEGRKKKKKRERKKKNASKKIRKGLKDALLL